MHKSSVSGNTTSVAVSSYLTEVTYIQLGEISTPDTGILAIFLGVCEIMNLRILKKKSTTCTLLG